MFKKVLFYLQLMEKLFTNISQSKVQIFYIENHFLQIHYLTVNA